MNYAAKPQPVKRSTGKDPKKCGGIRELFPVSGHYQQPQGSYPPNGEYQQF